MARILMNAGYNIFSFLLLNDHVGTLFSISFLKDGGKKLRAKKKEKKKLKKKQVGAPTK